MLTTMKKWTDWTIFLKKTNKKTKQNKRLTEELIGMHILFLEAKANISYYTRYCDIA